MTDQHTSSVEYFALTPDRWSDFETLFGPRGATGGCWCMYWRMKRPDFEAMKGDSNRAAMQAIVAAGRPPGILAYVDGQPAGWCSIAPRDEFPRLAGSRVAKRVDDQPVWSIVCFFVAKARRNQRLTVGLIQAAVRYAQSQGAKIVEAYPVEPHNERMPDVFAYTGIASAFRKAGFVEVARRSAGRPMMRYSSETHGT